MFQLIRLLRWSKFVKGMQMEERVAAFCRLGFRGRNVLKLASLIFFLAIVAHIGGCLWFYTTVLDEAKYNWTHEYGEYEDAACKWKLCIFLFLALSSKFPAPPSSPCSLLDFLFLFTDILVSSSVLTADSWVPIHLIL